MNDKEKKIHKLALKRFKSCVTADSDNRKAAIEDLKFYNGEQWTEEERRLRKSDLGGARPVFTVNILPRFVDQLVGDQRLNRPQIKVRTGDIKSDPQVALIKGGIIRDVEHRSNADFIHDSAFEMAVKCGYGAWRVLTRYTDDDSFEQEMYLQLIENPFNVFIDPTVSDPRDANYGFVLDYLSVEDYKELYPDKEPPVDITGKAGQGISQEHWFAKAEYVAVADYYYREKETYTLYLLSDGTTVEEKPVVEEGGIDPVIKEREAERITVKHYRIDAEKILEDEKKWPGKYIPLVLLRGKETNVEGKRYVHGLVRNAKDAQRMGNYWRTLAAEVIALAPKAPIQATVKQIEGLEKFYGNANISNQAVLPYNPDPQASGPPQRMQPAMTPQGIFAEIQLCDNDIKSTIGIFGPGLGEPSNETSGVAIANRQREGDVGNFVYYDNLLRSLKYQACIMLDLIPAIYDTERIVPVRGEDGNSNFAPVNMTMEGAAQTIQANPLLQRQFNLDHLKKRIFTGDANRPFNDLKIGHYVEVIETGPSYTTQRIEAANNMIKLMQANPDIGKICPDLIVEKFDFEGASDIARRLRKTLPPGIAEPKEGELPTPPPPPPPAVMLQMQKLQNEQAKIALKEKEIQLRHAAKMEELRVRALIEQAKITSSGEIDHTKMAAAERIADKQLEGKLVVHATKG